MVFTLSLLTWSSESCYNPLSLCYLQRTFLTAHLAGRNKNHLKPQDTSINNSLNPSNPHYVRNTKLAKAFPQWLFSTIFMKSRHILNLLFSSQTNPNENSFLIIRLQGSLFLSFSSSSFILAMSINTENDAHFWN